MNIIQDNTYWEWSEDKGYIEILWILKTEDGLFYQKKKKIKIGENNESSSMRK